MTLLANADYILVWSGINLLSPPARTNDENQLGHLSHFTMNAVVADSGLGYSVHDKIHLAHSGHRGGGRMDWYKSPNLGHKRTGIFSASVVPEFADRMMDCARATT
jgi:hypothetical protein